MGAGTDATTGQASRYRRTLQCVCVAAAALAAGTAHAQSAGPAPATGDPAGAQQGAVQDIIVTARRRDESLEKVPTAIAVLSGDEMMRRGVRSEADLQLAVPGLTLRQTQGSNQLSYSIRGQTVEAFTGSATAVVPYLNEVQQVTLGASSLYDLQSTQVLKGPQGTLFGRNSTGGAVLYTSARPEDHFEGYVVGRAGNYALRELQGAVSMPIVDEKVLLRVAFDLVHRDGYIDNVYTGQDVGAVRRQSGRATLVVKPVDGVTNTTIFEYDHAGGSSTGATYLYSAYACGAKNGGVTLNCTADLFYNPKVDSLFGPGTWAAYLAAHPKAYAGGFIAYLDEQRRLGLWKTSSATMPRYRSHSWSLSNTSTVDLTDDILVKNIFGASRSYSHDDMIETADPFGLEYPHNPALGEFGNVLRVRSVSDEIQLQGKAFDHALDFIVGGYFQKNSTGFLNPQAYFDLSPVSPSAPFTSIFRLSYRTAAVFAQGTWDLGRVVGLDGLHLTGGMRYTWDENWLDQLPGSNNYPAPRQTVHFQDPSWEAGLDYQAAPSWLVYLKTRGSFRSGGLNGFAPPVPGNAAEGGDQFNSEHTQDIEAGAKFGGRALGRPAHFNIAIYQQWVQGVQRSQFPNVNGNVFAVTINVPAAQIHGVEIDGAIRPAPWLEVGGSGAYTHAVYTKDSANLFGTTYTFGPYADTPRWTGTLYGQVTVPAPDRRGEIDFRLEGYGQTAQYFASADRSFTPDTRFPGYVLLNGRIDWSGLISDRLTLSLFAKNLTNKGYFVGGLAQGAAFGMNAASVGEPRMFGGEIKLRF